MKHLSIFMLLLAAGLTLSAQQAQGSIYQFQVEDLYGEPFDFADLQGRKVMIVNTASKCGFTPQYAGLQKLYETYADEGLVIIGFPANDFLKQEPGTNAEIAEFCTANYGVTFPMMAKISVKGNDMHPVYKYLTSKTLNGYADSKVKWNFQKYLVGEEGFLEKVVETRVDPLDPVITDWITGD